MELSFYHLDAFASRLFGGSPVVVVPLENWPPDMLLQAIARENGVASSAFFMNNEEAFHLRAFTPNAELDFSGQATLASAAVIFEELAHPKDIVHFDTHAGHFAVSRRDSRIAMNLPATPAKPAVAPDELIAAVGTKPKEVLENRDVVLVFDNADEVAALTPDLDALKRLVPYGLIATSLGDDCDFVSRFFAPARGVPEDSVTAAAHCTLAPYWANLLGRDELHARQLSKRGGTLWCTVDGSRVRIEGEVVFYQKGSILIGEG